MLRELFSSRLFVGGLIGCALLVAGMQFWSHHEISKLRRDEAATRKFIQKVEADKTASPTREGETEELADSEPIPVVTHPSDATSESIAETKVASVEDFPESPASVAWRGTGPHPTGPPGVSGRKR